MRMDNKQSYDEDNEDMAECPFGSQSIVSINRDRSSQPQRSPRSHQ